MRAKLAMLVILVGAVVVGTCLGESEDEGATALLLATVQELLGHPTPMFTEETSLAERLFVAVLPGAELAVILRPITEAELGSCQIQAISAQMIAGRC